MPSFQTKALMVVQGGSDNIGILKAFLLQMITCNNCLESAS